MTSRSIHSPTATGPGIADRNRHRPERATKARLVITGRDRAIIDTVVRLGATTSTVLRQLHAPDTDPQTVRRRLRRLTAARLLTSTGHIAPDCALHLYTVGPAALVPGQDRPWAPSTNQLEHTLAVGDTLLHLTSPDLADGIAVIGWEGEAELRGWAQPGHPRPDLRVHWQRHATGNNRDAGGWLQVEVDRATEAGAAWRRKLTRYLTHQPNALLLTVTTSDQRARGLARHALGVGVHLLALPTATLAAGRDPLVYDTRGQRRHPLSDALTTTPTTGGPR